MTKKREFTIFVVLMLMIGIGIPMRIQSFEKTEISSFEQISSSGSYKLMNDIVIPTTMNIEKSEEFTIDLNGHKITSNVGLSHDSLTTIINNNGKLVIEDSSPSKEGTFVSDALFGIRNYGSLVINSGKFTSDVIGYNITGDGKYSSRLVRNEKDAHLVINGGYFESKGGTLNTREGSFTTINNGTFISTSSSRDKVDGEDEYYTYCITSGGNITIKNATVKGIQGALGVFTGEAHVYDGNYSTNWDDATSHYGIYIAGEAGAAKGFIYGGKYSSPKYAAYIGNDADGGDKKDANVTIYDGEFVGKNRAISIAKQTAKDPQLKGGKYYIAKTENGSRNVDTNVKPYLLENYILNETTGEILAKNPDTIILDKENMKLEINNTSVLKATLTPNNLVDTTITWTTDNEEIAKVDKTTGKVTGVKPGTAIITATAGDKSASCTVTVYEIKAPVIPPVDKDTNVSLGEEAKEVLKDVVKDVIDNVKTSTAISNDTRNKLEAALVAGKEISVAPKVEVKKESAIEKEVVTKIENAMKETTEKDKVAEIAQYYDLSMMLTAAGEPLGTVNELTGKVEFTVSIPKDLTKAGRKFYMVRVHEDGDTERIEGKLDGTDFSFETDKFSIFALVYEDNKVETPTTPTEPTTPEKPETPTKPVTPTTPAKPSVDTGDVTDRNTLLVLLAMAGIVVVYGAMRYRKENR